MQYKAYYKQIMMLSLHSETLIIPSLILYKLEVFIFNTRGYNRYCIWIIFCLYPWWWFSWSWIMPSYKKANMILWFRWSKKESSKVLFSKYFYFYMIFYHRWIALDIYSINTHNSFLNYLSYISTIQKTVAMSFGFLW